MTDIAMRMATAAGCTRISVAQEHFQKPAKHSNIDLAACNLQSYTLRCNLLHWLPRDCQQ